MTQSQNAEQVPVFTLAQAQVLRRCRICGHLTDNDFPLVLNYGKEFAHERCLPKPATAPASAAASEDEAVESMRSKWVAAPCDIPMLIREAYRLGVAWGKKNWQAGVHDVSDLYEEKEQPPPAMSREDEYEAHKHRLEIALESAHKLGVASAIHDLEQQLADLDSRYRSQPAPPAEEMDILTIRNAVANSNAGRLRGEWRR